MPETSQCPHAQSPELDHPERPSFRKAPWFILGNPGIKSNGMALVLSVIWASIQGSGIPRTCKITNQEIVNRSGIRGGDQEVRRYLLLAERAGFIKRHGAHKNRTIELLLTDPEDGDLRGLIIPQNILESGSSITEKLLAAIKVAFPGAKKNWICKRLNISDWTYYTKINSELKPPEKTKTNPPKKLIEPPEKTNPIGIDGYSPGYSVISKDITNGPADRGHCFRAFLAQRENLPYKENKQNPSLKENDNMSLRIAFDTPSDPAWLKIQTNRLRLERISNGIRRNDTRKKPKPLKYANKNYPAEYLEDMEWIKANCPLIHISARGTVSFDNDILAIKALHEGPGRVLQKSGKTDGILSRVVGQTYFGKQWNYPLRREWCFEMFLGIQHNQEQRQELYRKLNNLMSAEYGGRGRKTHLSEALCSHNNWSFLFQVAVAEPKRPQDEFPSDLDDYRRQYDVALGLTPPQMAKDQEGRLAWTIRRLRKAYLEEFRTRRPEGYEGNAFYGDWPKFFDNLAEHFDNQDAPIWPGWFNPDGQWVKSFLAEAGFRDARAGCRPPAYNKKQEGNHAQW